MADQNPLSPYSAVPELSETNRTVPRTGEYNAGNITPADIAAYYQSKRGAFQTFRYPQDVGNSDEFPHWLKIQIHARAKNKAVMSRFGTSGTFHAPESQAIDPSSRAANARVTGALGVTAGANIAGGLANTVTNTLPTTFSPIQKLAVGAVASLGGAVIGGATGVAAGAVNINEYRTLSQVIGLGLQEPPKADYSATWESQDLGEFLATGALSPAAAAREFARNKAGMKGALGDVAGLTNQNITAAQELTSGKIRNPYKEQLFKQVEFRQFAFNFVFVPESIQEAQQILSIMNLLRTNMLPYLDKSSGYYLVYPAEFTLEYMYKNTRNTNVNTIGTSVLTDMSTSYGGQDFVTFKGSLGKPAEMSMSLTFKEIVPITANQVADESYGKQEGE